MTILASICEICGHPAVTVVVDVVRTAPLVKDADGNLWPKTLMDGEPHCFCEEHRRDYRKRVAFTQADIEQARAA